MIYAINHVLYTYVCMLNSQDLLIKEGIGVQRLQI